MNKWIISKDEQNKYIKVLTDALAPLRAKVGISQNDLAALIGVSRQTYSAIESGKREMTWSIYLSLIFFFDNNASTHQLLRDFAAFPDELLIRLNQGNSGIAVDGRIIGNQSAELSKMVSSLDEQGLHALKTVLLVEYARCKSLPGDAVIKSFNGTEFNIQEKNGINLSEAIRRKKDEKSEGNKAKR